MCVCVFGHSWDDISHMGSFGHKHSIKALCQCRVTTPLIKAQLPSRSLSRLTADKKTASFLRRAYGYPACTALVSSAAHGIGIRCQKERVLARAPETPAIRTLSGTAQAPCQITRRTPCMLARGGHSLETNLFGTLNKLEKAVRVIRHWINFVALSQI